MGGCNTTDVPTIQELECIFTVLIRNLLSVAGIIFFVMVLAGGFQYLTSGGDPESVAKAHKTLTYAVIGLIAATLSFMVLVVIEFVTGANVTEFQFFSN